MNIFYITLGHQLQVHAQAYFSIYTLLTQGNAISTINVVTDAPHFYNKLSQQIQVIPVESETIRNWKGDYDFFWRVKIKALQEVAARYDAQPVLYLDTDTFLYQPLLALQKKLDKGTAIMHLNEGALALAKSKTEKKTFAGIVGKTFGGLAIGAEVEMWNAGVVGIPNTKGQKDIERAVIMCDEMCREGVARRLIEQAALSIVLQHEYGLAPADNTIAHYWSNKEEWNTAISHFLLTAHLEGLSRDQVVERVKDFDFKKFAVVKRIRSTNLKLKKAVDRLFPGEDIRYINNVDPM